MLDTYRGTGTDKPYFTTKADLGPGFAALLICAGELDASGGKALHEAIYRLLDKNAHTLTVDLSGITFMDAGGLHAVVIADQSARQAGVSIAWTKAPPAIQRLFSLAEIEHHLCFLDPKATAEGAVMRCSAS
jgi:anti-anti-sigma factor